MKTLITFILGLMLTITSCTKNNDVKPSPVQTPVTNPTGPKSILIIQTYLSPTFPVGTWINIISSPNYNMWAVGDTLKLTQTSDTVNLNFNTGSVYSNNEYGQFTLNYSVYKNGTLNQTCTDTEPNPYPASWSDKIILK